METGGQDDVARLIKVFSLDEVSYREFGKPAAAETANPLAPTPQKPLRKAGRAAASPAREPLPAPKTLPLATVFAHLVEEGTPAAAAAEPEPEPPAAEPHAPSTPLRTVFAQLSTPAPSPPTESRKP